MAGEDIKVLHLTSGPVSGGAAKGVVLLNEALNQIGVQSTLALVGANKTGHYYNKFNYIPLSCRESVRSILSSRLPARVMRSGQHNFSYGMYGLRRLPQDLIEGVDILHCHWIAGGRVAIPSLFNLDVPVVWTFRDMWPFTGGCHYSLDCNSYRINCAYCPQLKFPFQSFVGGAFAEKMSLHRSRRIAYTSISKWLADRAEGSAVLRDKKVQHIENCISEIFFSGLSDMPKRQQYSESHNKKITDLQSVHSKGRILIGCQNLLDPYKGIDLFLECLNFLSNSDYDVHVFGIGEISIPGWTVHHHGFISDEKEMIALYKSCDLFVFPSRQEAFGKTVVEALASGVGVVCFPGTGASELIQRGMRAVVCKDRTARALAQGIVEFFELKFEERTNLSALEKYRPNVVAEKYRLFYQDLLKSDI